MLGRREVSLGLAALPLTHSRRATAIAGVRDLSAMVEAERAQAGIPGLGAALVGPGGLQALGVAGTRAWPDGPPVRPDDLWHIGSCTKTFTATLAARLVERGRLRWDTTIGQLLGHGMHAGWRGLTLLQLLSHRSGAPNNFDQRLWEQMVARGGSLRTQRAWLVAEGMKTPPPAPPDRATLYSNAGYLIAGAMLERAADRDWENLVRLELFAPLGLASPGFGAPGTPGRLDQPLGHVRGDGGGWRPIGRGRGDDNPAATGPAGTIHLSLPDWGRFVAAHLQEARGRRRLLGPASWTRLHVPGAADQDYVPGWRVLRDGDGPMLQQLGSNGFFVAQATLYPVRGRGVLLVSNAADDAVEAPFRRLLERLRDFQPG